MMANYLNDDNMKFIPCQFRNDICIGGIDNSEEYIEKRKWKKKKKFIMFMTIRTMELELIFMLPFIVNSEIVGEINIKKKKKLMELHFHHH